MPLVKTLSEGFTLVVGDAHIYLRKARGGRAELIVEAPRSTGIRAVEGKYLDLADDPLVAEVARVLPVGPRRSMPVDPPLCRRCSSPLPPAVDPLNPRSRPGTCPCSLPSTPDFDSIR